MAWLGPSVAATCSMVGQSKVAVPVAGSQRAADGSGEVGGAASTGLAAGLSAVTTSPGWSATGCEDGAAAASLRGRPRRALAGGRSDCPPSSARTAVASGGVEPAAVSSSIGSADTRSALGLRPRRVGVDVAPVLRSFVAAAVTSGSGDRFGVASSLSGRGASGGMSRAAGVVFCRDTRPLVFGVALRAIVQAILNNPRSRYATAPPTQISMTLGIIKCATRDDRRLNVKTEATPFPPDWRGSAWSDGHSFA